MDPAVDPAVEVGVLFAQLRAAVDEREGRVDLAIEVGVVLLEGRLAVLEVDPLVAVAVAVGVDFLANRRAAGPVVDPDIERAVEVRVLLRPDGLAVLVVDELVVDAIAVRVDPFLADVLVLVELEDDRGHLRRRDARREQQGRESGGGLYPLAHGIRRFRSRRSA